MWVSSRILNPDLSRPQTPIFPLWININFVCQIALSSNPETHPLLSLTFHTEDTSKPYLRYFHHTVLSHLSAACLSKNCWFSPEYFSGPQSDLLTSSIDLSLTLHTVQYHVMALFKTCQNHYLRGKKNLIFSFR